MKLHRNVYLWYLTTFFQYAAFTLPIWVIFNTETLGLSNTQAFLLGILSYGLSSVFEIPTGSWADKYGRVKMYQLGTVFYILSVASFIFFADFYILLAFQVIGGLGLAMQSGGLEALVHDSLPSKGKTAAYARIHGNKMAVLFISRVTTVALSGYMFAVDPKLPFVIAVSVYVVGLVISLLFREVRTEAPSEASHSEHIRETIRLMLSSTNLIFFSALVILYTFISEALFAFYQPYFRSIDVHIEEFGFFYAVISLFSALGALVVAKHMAKRNIFLILLLMMFSILFTLTIMLLRVPGLMYLAVIPSSISFGYVVTLHNTAIQKLITSRHQATAVSIASFTRSASFLVSVVLVGIALDFVSPTVLNIVLVSTATVLLIPFAVAKKRRITI